MYGGTASPNPDFPQEVQNVSGSVNVKVQNKNLCYSVSVPSGNKTVINFFINQNYIEKIFNMAFTPNESLSNNSLYCYVDGQSIGLITTFTTTANTRVVKAITLSDSNYEAIKNGSIVYFQLYKNGATFTVPDDAQIQNETITTYEPHEEQTATLTLPEEMEMCKIGTYQDSFVKQNGTWYKKQLVRHIELAIADMNNSDNNYPGWTNQAQMLADYNNKNGSLATLTDYYSNIALPSTKVLINTQSGSGGGQIFFTKAGFNLIQTQWKTNYPNLIFKLYYGLQTPDMVEITDTTLIEQLDNLANLYSYKGTTIISSDDEVSPIFDVEYIKDTVVGNLQGQIDELISTIGTLNQQLENALNGEVDE